MLTLNSIRNRLTFYNFCSLVGLGYLLVKGSHFLKVFLYEISFPEKDLLKRYGENSYAVVSGGTDGIGKALAKGLAKRGFNLVIIARNPEKLKEVEREIKEENKNIKVTLIVADYKESFREGFFDRIMNEIGDLDVSMLFNVAGTLHTHYVAKLTEDQIKEIIYVNCIPSSVLTRHFTERFLRREKKSAIVTMASMVSDYLSPMWQTYGASKSFVGYFSDTVAMEYPQIDVLTVKAGVTKTKLVESNSHNTGYVTPDKVAKAIFRRMGYVNTTYGHWKHTIPGEGQQFTPRFMITAMSNWMIKGSVRRDGGKKTPLGAD